ncbi:hypothetical protein L7F22_023877 [Adiantum nelumboides]|nr:hypothetical protein [Adiantum nelumboides]
MIVYSKNEEEHRHYLAIVFKELRSHRLLINAKKSEFFLEEIHFLGHIVSKDGVRMDPAKVEAIKSWPDLKTAHDVRSFLGLCSYYRRFIRNFAEIASPLHALQKKGVTFRWTQEEISAFNLLKEKMTSDPVIVLPDLKKSFVVQCDACSSSIGAVLMQDGRVVAYESRILQGLEKTMQVYEKELQAVINALLSWKQCLLGADFVVQTDHQTLRLRRKVMEESHVPSYAGHRGIDATVKAVETFFYWPTLRRDVDAFVRECIICQKVKFDRQKAPRLLQPLPIPDKPWKRFFMLLAEDQPEVKELDEILVPEQILAHKERKVKGKVTKHYLVKFRNYPPMDAKWMEEGELAESPTVLSLYLVRAVHIVSLAIALMECPKVCLVL